MANKLIYVSEQENGEKETPNAALRLNSNYPLGIVVHLSFVRHDKEEKY